MEKKKRKRIGKRDIVTLISMDLKANYRKMSKEMIITPVVNSFINSVNMILERGGEINLRGFGNFLIKDITKDKCIIGGKEYKVRKKRKVVFKYLNPNFK